MGNSKGVRVDLGELIELLGSLSGAFESREIDPDLVRARLADGLRDAGVEPAPAGEVAKLFSRLDEPGARKLAVLVEALRRPPLKPVLPELCQLHAQSPSTPGGRAAPGAPAGGKVKAASGPSVLVERALFGLSLATPLLTLSLVRQSPLRLEELARRWLAALGAQVGGETPEASAEQLARLDYERLLGEAERAKAAAEERASYLRKLQEAQEKKRPRGKW